MVHLGTFQGSLPIPLCENNALVGNRRGVVTQLLERWSLAVPCSRGPPRSCDSGLENGISGMLTAVLSFCCPSFPYVILIRLDCRGCLGLGCMLRARPVLRFCMSSPVGLAVSHPSPGTIREPPGIRSSNPEPAANDQQSSGSLWQSFCLTTQHLQGGRRGGLTPPPLGPPPF